MPYQELLDSPDGLSDHRGGPVWPDWEQRVAARHCRGGRPVDVQPIAGAIRSRLESVAWGGALVPHFGHQIADFSMRILPTLAARPDLPLAFATKPSLGIGTLAEAPDFFRQVLDWFGLEPARFVLITAPTLVRELVVFAQSEQLGGPGPGTATLDQLDELVERRLGSRAAGRSGTVYVSRVGQAGRFAGEAQLERALERAGVTVLHPGTDTQIAGEIQAYRDAEHIVFAEGSAMHVLQLSGRIGADVSVLVRRPGQRVAADSIEPRAATLRYVDVSAGLVHGLRPSGEPALPTGISVLGEEAVIEQLAGLGLGLREHWDHAAFERERDEDVRTWLGLFADSPRADVRGGRDAVVQSMREAALAHLAEDAAGILDRRDAAAASPVGPFKESVVVAPWSVRRLGRLAGALPAARYLEIGAGEGSTFSRISVAERVGVDPRFPRQRSGLVGSGVQLEETTSDAFFADLPPTTSFDLVLLDGLHRFEQMYRDLCNALMHTHRRTVILIDGTRPADPYAAVPDRQLAQRLRNIDAVAGGAWQGDVYKVVFALHDFHLELDYRTITGPGLPQTLVWRSESVEREPRFGSLGTIARLSYFDMLEAWDVMQACSEEEALEACLSEAGTQAPGAALASPSP